MRSTLTAILKKRHEKEAKNLRNLEVHSLLSAMTILIANYKDYTDFYLKTETLYVVVLYINILRLKMKLLLNVAVTHSM